MELVTTSRNSFHLAIWFCCLFYFFTPKSPKGDFNNCLLMQNLIITTVLKSPLGNLGVATIILCSGFIVSEYFDRN